MDFQKSVDTLYIHSAAYTRTLWPLIPRWGWFALLCSHYPLRKQFELPIPKKALWTQCKPSQTQYEASRTQLKPQRELVEYSWVGYFRVGISLGMSISCCLSPVFSRWVANVNSGSDGIWAFLEAK